LSLRQPASGSAKRAPPARVLARSARPSASLAAAATRRHDASPENGVKKITHLWDLLGRRLADGFVVGP
jgi:hypothetical protein